MEFKHDDLVTIAFALREAINTQCAHIAGKEEYYPVTGKVIASQEALLDRINDALAFPGGLKI